MATAQEAVAEFGRLAQVAGSVAPLEDCYRPDLVPTDDECRAEQSERIQHLVEAGVDLLLIETMNSNREAVIAARLATITGWPTWVSFVCDREGRILSGESVAVAAGMLMPLGVNALGVNCGPAHTLAKPLGELRAICGPDFPLFAYGNIGYADEAQGWINTDAVDPDSYLHYAETWKVGHLGNASIPTTSAEDGIPVGVAVFGKDVWFSEQKVYKRRLGFLTPKSSKMRVVKIDSAGKRTLLGLD